MGVTSWWLASWAESQISSNFQTGLFLNLMDVWKNPGDPSSTNRSWNLFFMTLSMLFDNRHHISLIRKQCRWCPWGIIKHIGGSSYTWRNGSANPLVFMRLEWWIFLSTQFRRFDLRTHSLPCESHLSCRVPPTIRREFLPYHRLHPREIPEQSHDDLVVHDFSVEFRRSWKPLNNQKGRERTMQKRQVLLLNWKVEPKTLEHKTTPPPGSWKEKRTQELGPTNSTFRTWIFQKSDVCVGCLALFALFDLPKMGTI